MKMTKKIMAVVIAAVATLGMASCKFGDFKGGKQMGTKKNMTVIVDNDGTTGKLFKRGWSQLGSSETVSAIETKITIDMSKVTGYAKDTSTTNVPNWVPAESTDTGAQAVNVVIGLIFDLHSTTVKADAATAEKPAGKYYDFVLVGYQPATKRYYIERYEDVPDGLFEQASNKGSFDEVAKEVKQFEGVKVTYITETSADVAWQKTSDADKAKVGKDLADGLLPVDEDTHIAAETVKLQELTVKVTQATDGTYVINLGDRDWPYTPTDVDATKQKNGKRIGGAGFYVNCPAGLSAKANFNSDNDNTIGLLAEEF